MFASPNHEPGPAHRVRRPIHATERSCGRTRSVLPVRAALSGWQTGSGHGTVLGMTKSANPYRGFRFPAEMIEDAVWLYRGFSLSLRDVETILAARGVAVSYESIRE